MKYLLDTNVISEVVRPKPNTKVLQFLSEIRQPVVSAISIAEIEYGVELRDGGRTKDALQAWLMELKMSAKVLPITESIAAEAGRLKAKLERKGRTLTLADALIAATAICHGLTLASRNLNDFRHSGVELIDPFGRQT